MGVSELRGAWSSTYQFAKQSEHEMKNEILWCEWKINIAYLPLNKFAPQPGPKRV